MSWYEYVIDSNILLSVCLFAINNLLCLYIPLSLFQKDPGNRLIINKGELTGVWETPYKRGRRYPLQETVVGVTEIPC